VNWQIEFEVKRMVYLWVISCLWLGLVAAPRAIAGDITKAPAPAKSVAVKVETIAKGLEHPWALQFLPDGRMLVTERPGRLRIVDKSGKLLAPIIGVPGVAASGQGGLLDLALDPNFATNRLIYWTFAEPRGIDTNGTSVARGELVFDGEGGRLDKIKIIFRQLPAASGGLHFGSRLAFARDGSLFVALGERYQKDRAQDLANHFGKVVRITPDGGVPKDNPFVGPPSLSPSSANQPSRSNADRRAEIWSYGHRNIQSAAIHPVTGKLWTVEHGPKGGDEINVPQAGKNYGWPVIGYGVDYSGAKLHDATSKPGMEQPIYYWVPSIAPSGMAFYANALAPEWSGNLFVGALAGQHLARLVLDGETIVAEERMLTDLGERIRDVRVGPDGGVYVLTDHPNGRIMRITPTR
jgi:aldose sugar dehydrogenase